MTHALFTLRKFRPLSIRDTGSVTTNPPFSSDKPLVVLDWTVESPPITFYGHAGNSSGALFSGQLVLLIQAEKVRVQQFEANLYAYVLHKWNFNQPPCGACQKENLETVSWKIFNTSTTLRQGTHYFPVSCLLKDSLPPSIDTPTFSIHYELLAKVAISADNSFPGDSSLSSSFTALKRTILVSRALSQPLLPHSWLYTFPNTTITAKAKCPSVVYPATTNKVTIKLEGLVSQNTKFQTIDFWEPTKVAWKLEETVQLVPFMCEKHIRHGQSGTSPEKIVKQRSIGAQQLSSKWRSNFDDSHGIAEMDIEFFVGGNVVSNHSSNPGYAFDLEIARGTKVTHSLQIEVFISKKYAPEGEAHRATSLGIGRMLCMSMAVTLASHPGNGVSWEDEELPTYASISPNLPTYADPENIDEEYTLDVTI